MRIWIGFAALVMAGACASAPAPAVKAPSAPSAGSVGPLQGKTYACASSSASGQLVLAADQYEVRNAAKNLKSGRGKMKVSGDTFTPLSGPLIGKVGQRTKGGAIEFEPELLGSSAATLTCSPG